MGDKSDKNEPMGDMLSAVDAYLAKLEADARRGSPPPAELKAKALDAIKKFEERINRLSERPGAIKQPNTIKNERDTVEAKIAITDIPVTGLDMPYVILHRDLKVLNPGLDQVRYFLHSLRKQKGNHRFNWEAVAAMPEVGDNVMISNTHVPTKATVHLTGFTEEEIKRLPKVIAIQPIPPDTYEMLIKKFNQAKATYSDQVTQLRDDAEVRRNAVRTEFDDKIASAVRRMEAVSECRHDLSTREHNAIADAISKLPTAEDKLLDTIRDTGCDRRGAVRVLCLDRPVRFVNTRVLFLDRENRVMDAPHYVLRTAEWGKTESGHILPEYRTEMPQAGQSVDITTIDVLDRLDHSEDGRWRTMSVGEMRGYRPEHFAKVESAACITQKVFRGLRRLRLEAEKACVELREETTNRMANGFAEERGLLDDDAVSARDECHALRGKLNTCLREIDDRLEKQVAEITPNPNSIIEQELRNFLNETDVSLP